MYRFEVGIGIRVFVTKKKIFFRYSEESQAFCGSNTTCVNNIGLNVSCSCNPGKENWIQDCFATNFDPISNNDK